MILISCVQVFALTALGMMSGFGKNTCHRHDLVILCFLGIVVLIRESVRGKMLFFYNKKNKKYFYLMTTLFMAAADWSLLCFLLSGDTGSVALALLYMCKAVAESAVLTYGVLYGGTGTGILYSFITEIPLLLFPFLVSDESRVLILRIVFLFILYREMKKDIREYCPSQNCHKKSSGRAAAVGIFCLAGAACLAYPFMLGKFPVYPVAIASGSMQPELKTGDMVLVVRADLDELQAGDIIQFQSGGGTVIHRINEVVEQDGGKVFVTKGDSNRDADPGVVQESQVMGKVVMDIPFLGWLTIWVHNAACGVQTGNM